MKLIPKYIVGLGCLLCLTISFSLSSMSVLAADDVKFEIIPKVDPTDLQQVNHDIMNTNGNIRDVYDNHADTLGAQEGGTALQVASGVMNRDTIINYAIMVLRFLSQLGLLIGGLMVVYTGWKYIMSVITGDSAPSSELIKNAILGILVIIFSYAILRILYRAFL